jgi:hypothetical protein
MRSYRRAFGLLAASAPLALAVACADPDLKSELVTEGPPEVVEVNVLSESVVLNDPTHLRLGEGATFCRPGDYKVNNVYCPEARDSNNKPMPGQRETDPIQDATPFGAGLGMESTFFHVRLIFDELLDPNVEDLETVDGVTFGTIAETMPVTVTCNDAEIAYDGFYDPSGNHLSYPPGPGLVVTAAEFVPTSSQCSISINAGVTDKDGVEVPSDQRGPYEFAVAALAVYGVAPAEAEEGVDPAATVDIEFNAPIDIATVAASITFEDDGGTAVPFTVELAPADPADPEAGTIPNIVSLVPDAPLDPATTYTVTIDSGIADIGGGALTVDAPVVVNFTTAAP